MADWLELGGLLAGACGFVYMLLAAVDAVRMWWRRRRGKAHPCGHGRGL